MKFLDPLRESLLMSIRYSDKKKFTQGMLGVVGFPLFYFVWVYFGEKYENLELRLLGSVLCMIYALGEYWPKSAKKYYNFYCVFMAIFSFPFFFTYMALKNDFSTVWMLSLFAAIYISMNLVKGVGILFISFVGMALSILIYVAEGNYIDIISEEFLKFTTIIFFAMIFGNAFSYTNERARLEKLEILKKTNKILSHEISNYLSGQSILVKNIKPIVEELIENYNKNENLEKDLSPELLYTLMMSLDILEANSDNAVTILDIFYHNQLTTGEFDGANFKIFDLHDLINRAIIQYPYLDIQNKNKIKHYLMKNKTVLVFGSETLLLLVIFNLLRNSFIAINEKKSDAGQIILKTWREKNMIYLSVWDNGIGMPQKVLKQIYNPEYTTRKNGMGLGLTFCRKVMSAFRGNINCVSVNNEYTEFILGFPAY